jgi:hypothetical protein
MTASLFEVIPSRFDKQGCVVNVKRMGYTGSNKRLRNLMHLTAGSPIASITTSRQTWIYSAIAKVNKENISDILLGTFIAWTLLMIISFIIVLISVLIWDAVGWTGVAWTLFLFVPSAIITIMC